MVRGSSIAVTAVAPKYQWAETTSSARGRGSCRPNARHASVYPFLSSGFIGLPWPMKRAGIRSIGTPLRCVTILIDESAVTEARGENPMRPNEHEQSGRADVDPEAETIEHREQS